MRSFRLMNAPDIETRDVTARAAMNSPDTGPSFILKNGVIFRTSRIIIMNMMKIENRVIACLTEV